MRWSPPDADPANNVVFHYLYYDNGVSPGYVIEDRRLVPTKFRACVNHGHGRPLDTFPATTSLESAKEKVIAHIIASRLEGQT